MLVKAIDVPYEDFDFSASLPPPPRKCSFVVFQRTNVAWVFIFPIPSFLRIHLFSLHIWLSSKNFSNKICSLKYQEYFELCAKFPSDPSSTLYFTICPSKTYHQLSNFVWNAPATTLVLYHHAWWGMIYNADKGSKLLNFEYMYSSLWLWTTVRAPRIFFWGRRAKCKIPSAVRAKFSKWRFQAPKKSNFEVSLRKLWIFSDLGIKFGINVTKLLIFSPLSGAIALLVPPLGCHYEQLWSYLVRLYVH